MDVKKQLYLENTVRKDKRNSNVEGRNQHAIDEVNDSIDRRDVSSDDASIIDQQGC